MVKKSQKDLERGDVDPSILRSSLECEQLAEIRAFIGSVAHSRLLRENKIYQELNRRRKALEERYAGKTIPGGMGNVMEAYWGDRRYIKITTKINECVRDASRCICENLK